MQRAMHLEVRAAESRVHEHIAEQEHAVALRLPRRRRQLGEHRVGQQHAHQRPSNTGTSEPDDDAAPQLARTDDDDDDDDNDDDDDAATGVSAGDNDGDDCPTMGVR